MRPRSPRRLRIASPGKKVRGIRRKVVAIAVRGTEGAFGDAERSPSEALCDRDAARFDALADALRSSGWSFSLLTLAAHALPDASFAEEASLFFCPAYDLELYAWLEANCLAFVGPSRASLELMRSRPRLKSLWRSAGLATPSWFAVGRPGLGSRRDEIERLVGEARDFPYVIKPASEAVAEGYSPALSIAYDSRALMRSVESGLSAQKEIIVERFLEGAASYSVAAIGNIAPIGGGAPAALLPVAPRLKGARPIGAVTRGDLSQGLAEAGLVSGPEGEAIVAFGRRALAAAGARDCARLELVEQNGELWALSLDPLPPIPDPWFRSCAAAVGLDEAAYVSAIFDSALARHLA
jgi:hypothetical protein